MSTRVDTPEPSLASVIDSGTLQWILVGGKGGVGKSTCACATATQIAERRPSKRVLVISTDPAHNVSDAFAQRFSREPQLVAGFDNLYAMEIDPERDFSNTELGRALFDDDGDDGSANNAAFHASDPLGISSIMNDLMQSVPGIDEALSFGHMMKSVQEMDYDLIVFDTAPTGHTLKLLSFPSLLERGLTRLLDLRARFAPMMNMASAMMGMPTPSSSSSEEEAAGGRVGAGAGAPSPDQEMAAKLEEMLHAVRRVDKQFRDHARTTFVCVCIPEFLSVYETERLVQELRRMNIACADVVVNQVLRVRDAKEAEADSPDDSGADARENSVVTTATTTSSSSSSSSSASASASTALELFESRVALQGKYLQQIEDLYGEDFNVTRVPQLTNEVRGVERLRKFGAMLTADSGIRPREPVDPPAAECSLRNVLEQASSSSPSLEMVITGGKGGVGKTTTSSALALELAESAGKRVLLVSTDPAHNLSDAFDQRFTGTEPTRVRGVGNAASGGALDVLEVDSAHFLTDLHADDDQMQFGGGGGGGGAQGITDELLDAMGGDRNAAAAAVALGGGGGGGGGAGGVSEMLRDLIRAVPGIDEAISFTRLMKRIHQLDYDIVVLDTAPTGHTLRLLSFPELLQRGLDKLEELRERFSGAISMASSLFGGGAGGGGGGNAPRPEEVLAARLHSMQRTINKVVEQFQDANRTTFVCVCIAEFLSVYETERLVQDLAEFSVDTHNVVVNQLFPPASSAAERVEMVRARVAMQRKYLRQVHALYGAEMHVVEVALQPREVRGVESIRAFSKLLR